MRIKCNTSPQFRRFDIRLMYFMPFLSMVGLSICFSQGDGAYNFSSPIKYPIVLAGSFGELRRSHFHGGIDIKPQKLGTEGDTIVSIGDGYISKIKVQNDGYGKSLVINHPGGLSSIYGHLKNFDSRVDSVVIEAQLKAQNYEVEIIPDKEKFKISRGQYIGNMGNTGYSYGPHLHLEIIETDTGKKLNPKLFGIRPKDNISPTFEEISLIGLNEEYRIISRKNYKTYRNKNGKYSTIAARIPFTRAAISVSCFDRMSGAPNKNGIFELEMWVDGELYYKSKKDKITPEDNEKYKFFVDYAFYKKKNKNIIQCFCLPSTKCSIVTHLKNNGIIELDKNKAKEVTIIARDLDLNESKIQLKITGTSEEPPFKMGSYTAKISPRQEDTVLQFHDLKLHWPQGAYCLDLFLSLDTLGKYRYSILPNDIALIRKPVIEIKIPDEWLEYKDKICIVNSSKIVTEKQLVSKNTVKTPIRETGNYELMIDTVPPRIKPINVKSKVMGDTHLKFKIEDSVKSYYAPDRLSIQTFVNNEFVPAEYNIMNKTLYIPIESLANGTHHLMIVATDHKKNVSTYQATFTK